MDAHAPITYYQTTIPPGHPMPYPNGRASLGVGALTPISMDSMGTRMPVYSNQGQAPPTDSGYGSAHYHSAATTSVPVQHQQYQQQQPTTHIHLQQQQQQQYMPLQTMVTPMPQSQPQSHQQQHHQQQIQSIQPITTSQHNISHSHSYKQPQQPPYIQQTQQTHLQQQLQQQHQIQHHMQAQQAQQVQQAQQRQQILGPAVVTSHPTHQSQIQVQPHMHQQLHQHPSVKSQSQQQQQQQQQQPQHHQHRDHARDHRNGYSNSGAMEHVINPQTSTLQLAEFASVMVYTLWHTRPNINGASSNAYNVVPHRISVPPSAGPAFRKFCLKVLSATQLSSSVILLSLKYIQKLLKNNPSIHGQQGSEFRLFTVSLMLANKFLDDNTFTNKTWSEVTGISVKEINVMEMEFLNQVQFSLFVSEAEYLDWLHSLETWLKQQGQTQTQGPN
ncbi:cyclin-domain-containing protein [Gamsiella multidivaricata]|uniref:cyclin-domain-containing protein n=1 Tax=Gamsiella multidivaricata TaxID=101098 RepID=UPI0022208EAF|nr:cyclin-domain-containing protein [Gamsiella multidivaricata]KAI7831127.1 cyclin-domain-containing protein [Gamsiella multidivaricata]